VERFEGNRGLALRFGATAVFLMAVATVPAVAGALRFASLTGANAALVVFSVGFLCAMGLLLLYAARDASAFFVVDEEGITRHAWGRTTALAWRDIVREREFHPTLFKGAADVSWRWVLYDRHGRKLIIPVRWLEMGPRLSALVEPHLASLRAARWTVPTRLEDGPCPLGVHHPSGVAHRVIAVRPNRRRCPAARFRSETADDFLPRGIGSPRRPGRRANLPQACGYQQRRHPPKPISQPLDSLR
jgi:hypothetical protein